MAQHRLLSKVTYGHLVDIIRLAPKGRELDKIGMLRAAQSAILAHLVGELRKDEVTAWFDRNSTGYDTRA